MSTLTSNARTATKGGSVGGKAETEKLKGEMPEEIRNGLALREAVVDAGWEAVRVADGLPFAVLEVCNSTDTRAKMILQADAACRVIAERVVLPRIQRCLRDARKMPGNEEAMNLAICYEGMIQVLTGMNATEAHYWVRERGTTRRSEG